jgi:hypothetical protein
MSVIWYKSGGREIKIFLFNPEMVKHSGKLQLSSVQEAVLVRFLLDLATLWRSMWQYSSVTLHRHTRKSAVTGRNSAIRPTKVRWLTWTLFTSPCSKENYFGVMLYRSPKTRHVWLLFCWMCEKCCSSNLNKSEAYVKEVLYEFSHQNSNTVTPRVTKGSSHAVA